MLNLFLKTSKILTTFVKELSRHERVNFQRFQGTWLGSHLDWLISTKVKRFCLQAKYFQFHLLVPFVELALLISINGVLAKIEFRTEANLAIPQKTL